MEIINETATNIHSSADDYVKNGILYCGKCNTPKQVYIEYFGKAMPTPCKCRQEQLQKEKEREEKMKKALKIKELREASLLGKRFESANFDNTETAHSAGDKGCPPGDASAFFTETAHSAEFKTVYDRCKRYCEIADDVLINGIGIYLFGTNGTGKTRLTACMGNELMNNGYTVLYTNFTEIARKTLKSDAFIKQLSGMNFLFIDDFGTEKVVKGNEDIWLQEKVFEVINKRYIDRKPIIFTANYSLKELIEDRGIAKRSVDRIMEMCEVIKLEGQSYRLTATKQRKRLF